MKLQKFIFIGAVSAFNSVSFAQELWLQKADALELRTTGEVQTMCSDLINSPEKVIMNVRLIDESNDIYLFAPSIGVRSELKIGTLQSDGTLNLTENYKEKFNKAKTMVIEKDDLLTFKFEFSDSFASMPYLRSTTAEVSEYYKAQERCLD